jgi:two-component system sensor histidine kinase CiaH
MTNRIYKFNSAYLKLTTFYVLIVMTISISFSVVLYNISLSELGRGLGRQNGILKEMTRKDPLTQQFQDLELILQNQLDESNDHLRLNLIYFNLLILLLSSISSYFLARKTLEPIEEAVNAQSHFTADASHELRTPLTAMKTGIEVSLRDKKLNLTSAKTLLESNLEEIGKLENLSNALLKLARFQESDKHFDKVDLEEIVVESYEKVESLGKKKNITFVPELIKTKVIGDQQSLVELFIILFENAIKYSNPGTKVRIVMQKDGSHSIVRVIDSGIGIKASDLPLIFNRFYRADTSRSKITTDGYGLGLSIAKQIIDIHGATINVKSTPNKGSEFIVRF